MGAMRLGHASEIGVIVNPRAGQAPAAAVWQASVPGAHVAEPATAEALPAVMQAMRAQGVRLLVSVGGDGTLSHVLTAAADNWASHDDLPAVLPVAAGTMNMVAHQMGWRMSPLAAAHWLADTLASQRELSLRLQHSIVSASGQVGFTAGFGVPARFLAAYAAGRTGYMGAVRQLLRFSMSGALGQGAANSLFAPIDLRWGVGEADTPASWSLGLVMRIDALPLNFRVAPGAADDDQLHLLHGAPSARAVLRDLANLYCGRALVSEALQRTRVAALHVEFAAPTPWMMDGDVFAPVSALTLNDGPPIRCVVPQ